MEIKATLTKPYTEEQRIGFIVTNNHNLGYEIRETETELQAWGKTYEETLADVKRAKYDEANNGAKAFLESGNALFEFEVGKHIEATDGNIGKFTGYAVGYITGRLQPTDAVDWNTKEDETVFLTAEQVGDILNGLGKVQGYVWTVQFPAYVQAIQEAKTIEEVNAITIEYYSETPVTEDV